MVSVVFFFCWSNRELLVTGPRRRLGIEDGNWNFACLFVCFLFLFVYFGDDSELIYFYVV